MRVRRFALFHLSLVPPRQPTLLAEELTRQEYLAQRLKHQFEFPYRGGEVLVWLPLFQDAEIVGGLIQRQTSFRHHLPPSEGGQERISEVWQGSYVLIDTSSHDKGQRAAVEIDVVGQPQSLLKALFAYLNSALEAPFIVEFDPIFRGEEFWDYSSKSGDLLEWIKFDFSVPNMWDAEGEIDRELRDTGEQTGAQRVEIAFRGKRGIFTRNQKVTDAVTYSQRGAGTIIAKAPGRPVYRSSDTQAVTEIVDSAEEDASVVQIVSPVVV